MNFKVVHFLKGIIFVGLNASLMTSCAYRLSNKTDHLPGNAHVLFVPVFQNESVEPGAEIYFTDSLRSEILKSGYAQIANTEAKSDAVLYGKITKIETVSDEHVAEAKSTKYLPNETVIATQSTVIATVQLKLQKKGSSEVFWSGELKQARNYTPPQVTLPVLNSANNLYNASAKVQTLKTLSQEMMQSMIDRIVDDF